jgi:hypothetical protein
MDVQGKETNMLNRKVTEWSNTECKYVDKGLVTEHIGRSLYVASEVVRIMSDVWEDHMFLYSIRDDGTLARDCVGYYDQKIEDRPVWLIDADAEAFELYRAKQEADKFESLVYNTNADYANPAVKGRVVKVVRGRNAPVGKVGKVVVVIERPYGMGYRSVMKPKLGIATSPKMVEKVMPNGKVFMNHADMIWVWAHNCEVENPQTADESQCRKMAVDFAQAAVNGLRKRQADAYQNWKGQMNGYKAAA